MEGWIFERSSDERSHVMHGSISLRDARRIQLQSLWIATCIVFLCSGAPVIANAQAPCPTLPASTDPLPDLSVSAATRVPEDACVPLGQHPGGSIPLVFFDHYAWRAFIEIGRAHV